MNNFYQTKKLNGVPHAVETPAVITEDGTKIWYQYGVKHRLDGPAVEHSDGTKEWWVAGYRHRKKGLAIEYPDGTGVAYTSPKAAVFESKSGILDLQEFLKRNPPHWLFKS